MEEDVIKLEQMQQEKEAIAAEAERAIKCIAELKEVLAKYEY